MTKQKMTLQELHIDNSWTLFLDRDGVINIKRDNDYVKRWEEFEFLDGTLTALKELTNVFGKIVITTNQRGIAKGLYSEQDFADITSKMLAQIEKAGGKIDAVFFCPHMGTEEYCNCRKPKAGLALQAKDAFPEINFKKSILIGDSASDIEFGKRCGMVTIQVNYLKKAGADFHFRSLKAATEQILAS